ncbi:MAG: SurA N-terminal domain-containing protein, partial [Burkholderiaceae bacterium]
MSVLTGLCIALVTSQVCTSAMASTARMADRIVAVVNAEVITETELNARSEAVRRRILREGGAPPPQEELREQVLEKLVTDSARMQAARSVGINIDPTTIDRTMARLASEAGRSLSEFQKEVTAEGIPMEVFRQELAVELAMNRVRERDIDSRIQVSEAEVDAWLEEQKTAVPQINLAQILVPVPEGAPAEAWARAGELAARIARGARAGADFNRIVTSLSATGERVSGGSLG